MGYISHKDNSRILHIDFIRIVAIIFVMFVHSGPRGVNYYQITSNRLLGGLSLIMSIICNSGVYLFFLVSGAVLLSHPESAYKIYKKRLPRMCVILVVFSIIRYLYVEFLGGGWETYDIQSFFEKLFSDKIFSPFWFLYAYISILIVLPFLKKMINGMERFEWIAFGIISLVFSVFSLMRVFGMPESEITFLFSGSPVLAFILGYANENDCFSKRVAIRAGEEILSNLVICVIIIVAQFIFVSMFGVSEIMSVTYLPVILAFLEYRIIKKVYVMSKISQKTKNCICTVASCSFGIYLIEDYVRNMLSKVFTVLEPRMTTLPACVVWILCSYFVALAIVYIYKVASSKCKQFANKTKSP